MASEGFHEPRELLSETAIDRHRAIASLMEELEAIDWYDQRITATADASLAAVLTHSRDEEKEHAAMTLEWLRRNDPGLDATLRQYLFTEAPLTEIEQAEAPPSPADDEHDAPSDGSLGIGSLKWMVR